VTFLGDRREAEAVYHTPFNPPGTGTGSTMDISLQFGFFSKPGSLGKGYSSKKPI